MPTILITYNLHDHLLKKLESIRNFKIVQKISKYPFTSSQLSHLLQNKDGILSTLTDKLSKDVLSSAKNLKVISQCSAGLDNIDIEYAKQRGIAIYNTPTVLSKAVAELTIGMILASLRNIIDAHIFTKSRKFTGWKVDLFLGQLLEGKTAGIVGMGNIGREVAKKLHCLGAKILYYAKSRKKDLEQRLNITFCNLEQLLEQSDIITVHLPLTSQTNNLLDATMLSRIKKGAIFINTSRGEIVDEMALIKLLKNKHLSYAALDVYTNEPYINKQFLKLKNIMLLPHIGSAVRSIRFAMMEQAVNNIINFFQ
ncbi:MAG: 2-hydroxyacid dehydrogenase [Planctomycetota bacterium]